LLTRHALLFVPLRGSLRAQRSSDRSDSVSLFVFLIELVSVLCDLIGVSCKGFTKIVIKEVSIFFFNL
jgi:hypothetical protein